MIISSDKEMVIGKIYRNEPLTNKDGEHKIVTLQVLRVATLDEYLNYCKEAESIEPTFESEFHYQVSMD